MNERIDRTGVKEERNMSALERKVDTLILFCTADTEEQKRKYHWSLRQLLGLYDTVPMGQSRRQRIDKVLSDLGIPDHLRGHEYLLTAIEMSLEDPEAVHNVTYGLYPAVAGHHNTRPQLVERAIRHAIECGWTRCDLDMQERYFGGKVDPNRCKPTNSEFIARVCNILRRQLS